MRYYLIAGEPSGDLHGSKLIAGLRKADPQAEFRFWGGDLMAAAGGAENLSKHYRETSFFGIATVLRNLRIMDAYINAGYDFCFLTARGCDFIKKCECICLTCVVVDYNVKPHISKKRSGCCAYTSC
mgnify:CR=1 FL=1